MTTDSISRAACVERLKQLFPAPHFRNWNVETPNAVGRFCAYASVTNACHRAFAEFPIAFAGDLQELLAALNALPEPVAQPVVDELQRLRCAACGAEGIVPGNSIYAGWMCPNCYRPTIPVPQPAVDVTTDWGPNVVHGSTPPQPVMPAERCEVCKGTGDENYGGNYVVPCSYCKSTGEKPTQPAAADTIGGFPLADPNCKGCGKPLVIENAWMTDGCPCNSPLGVNSLNETRWRLLMALQQRQSTSLEVAKELADHLEGNNCGDWPKTEKLLAKFRITCGVDRMHIEVIQLELESLRSENDDEG